MPNRIFRDGFVDSEAVSALTDWTHRVYSNLLVKSDDAGRFDGRLEIFRSHLFPLGTTRRIEDFRKALTELDEQSLAILYKCNGKPFIQVTKWQRCGSTATSRYPWRDGSHRIEYVVRETRDGPKEFVVTSIIDGVNPPCGPHADGVAIELNTETETETETKKHVSRASRDVPPGFSRFWSAFPPCERKVGKTDCQKLWDRKGLEPITGRVVAALERAKTSRDWTKDGGAFIPMPKTWLNRTSWETDPADLVGEELGGFERKPVTDEVLRKALGLRDDEEIPR